MLGNLDIEVHEGVISPLDEEEFSNLCELVLSAEGVDRECYVSISLVDDEEMRDINAEWRGIDRVTDVVSLECERPDDPDLADGEPCQLGDIILAPSYIAHQAAEFGSTTADECRLLFVHGMLHLLGYDHLEDEEAEVMEAREDELLALAKTDAVIDHVTITRHREDGSR